MRIVLFVVGGVFLLSSNVLLEGPGTEGVPVHYWRVLLGLGLISLGFGWQKVSQFGRIARRFWEKPVLSVKYPR
jgi:hypothetical protein